MKERKIVIIRGHVTAGKTTASHELAKVLPGWIFIDVWKIKEMFEPLGLKDRTPLKEISKKAMISIMKEVIRTMGINIIVQETTQKFVKKYLDKDIKKSRYRLYSFFLHAELKDALKRNIQREKPAMDINTRNLDEEEWRKTKAQPDKGDILINTSKNNPKQVVDIILKNIKEKRRKHPKKHLIRKTW